MVNYSPFLHTGPSAQPGALTVLHLRRDHLMPIVLREEDEEHHEDGIGPVENTRFGSYPHSTILGQPWGTQILASKVNTGSRGQKKKNNKRKIDESQGRAAGIKGRGPNGADGAFKKAKFDHYVDGNPFEGEIIEPNPDDATPPSSVQQIESSNPAIAASGFCHILPPTAESWTLSLPHRTQVVYTPDYSYIIQKIRARPGSVLIEAGAGSGSFTHAAARAVFSGYAEPNKSEPALDVSASARKNGRVYSYEYHAPRHAKLRAEIEEHGLSSVVQVIHRDVYSDGFLLHEDDPVLNTEADSKPPSRSPLATQIFLDLPSPWEALPHLSRKSPSALDPTKTVHICIFLPCIEQVQQAVAALRMNGWLEVTMHEVAQRRLDVRREHVGLDLQGLRNVNASPATVEEAVERLIQVEKNGRRYQNAMVARAKKEKERREHGPEAAELSIVPESVQASDVKAEGLREEDMQEKRKTKAAIRAQNLSKVASTLFKEGRLVHRTEPEIRTHTSYLIFAVLPIEWTEEDEARCREKWLTR